MTCITPEGIAKAQASSAGGQEGARPSHIGSLTAFRGIAAITVVVYHFSGGFLPELRPGDYTAFFSRSYLWVDFFFLLSGFVLAHSYADKFRDGLRGGTEALRSRAFRANLPSSPRDTGGAS